MFLKNRNIIFKKEISKVTDYVALDLRYLSYGKVRGCKSQTVVLDSDVYFLRALW